jgi:hypothetical protein
MQRFIISPLFSLSRFFINTYGIFLKFFLQLNGGYWSRIGLTENITEERIKKKKILYLTFLYSSGFIVWITIYSLLVFCDSLCTTFDRKIFKSIE